MQNIPTLYINLESRVDRKQHIEQLLKETLGMKHVMRVNAIKQEQGWKGCTLSHILAVNIAKKLGYSQVFIVEDDMTFPNNNPEQLHTNYTHFIQQRFALDVLFLGANIMQAQALPAPHHTNILKLKQVCSSVAYVLSASFYDKWINMLKQSIVQGVPLDVYWQNLIQQSNAYVVLPLCVSQLKDYSDIEKKTVDYDWLMLTYPKYRRKSGLA
jgi:GR25 family glycosyltransferase involved in LPS biosynthesis